MSASLEHRHFPFRHFMQPSAALVIPKPEVWFWIEDRRLRCRRQPRGEVDIFMLQFPPVWIVIPGRSMRIIVMRPAPPWLPMRLPRASGAADVGLGPARSDGARADRNRLLAARADSRCALYPQMPTVVVTPLVRDHGVDYLFAATILMGVIQVVAGLLRATKGRMKASSSTAAPPACTHRGRFYDRQCWPHAWASSQFDPWWQRCG